MRRSSRRGLALESALAAVLIFASASVLPAQKNKKDQDASARIIQGIVSDADGNPMKQAVVQLKDTRTLQVISFITLEDGSYHFGGLKTDTEYQLKAQREGASTEWKRVSVFDPRKVVTLNLKLEKSKPEEDKK